MNNSTVLALSLSLGVLFSGTVLAQPATQLAAQPATQPVAQDATPLNVVTNMPAPVVTVTFPDSGAGVITNPQATTSLKVWLNKDPNGIGMSQYSVGDTLAVGVQVSQDAYIYLFDISSDGHISLFAPNGYDGPRGNFVRAGRKVMFPGAGAKYTLTVGGPLGQSRVLALASRVPLNLSDIATFVGQQGFGTVSIQGEPALGQALGSVVSKLQPGDWVSSYSWYGVGEPGLGNPETAKAPAVVVPVPAPAPVGATTPAGSIAAGERPDHTVDRAIQEAYSRLRGASSLGQASDYAQSFSGGIWQKFAGVAAYGKGIVFHQAGAAQAYAVHGKVLERYLSLAQAESALSKVPTRLGWPVGDEKILPRNNYGRTGYYAPFASGALYSSDKGTFWLTSDLLAKYQALGGAGSALGFPLRDQYLYNGHWAAQFEGGSLRWNGTSYIIFK